MWFYTVSKFWFFYCCKGNTGPENLFHVFQILCLHLQTGWKLKKNLGGMNYPIDPCKFSINSDLNHYINSTVPFATPGQNLLFLQHTTWFSQLRVHQYCLLQGWMSLTISSTRQLREWYLSNEEARRCTQILPYYPLCKFG